MNGPAFPTAAHPGMTLRDYFAAQAMQAHIVANFDILAKEPEVQPGTVNAIISAAAYEVADAMLKARMQEPAK